MKTSWITFTRFLERELHYLGYSFDIDKAVDSKELNRIYDISKTPSDALVLMGNNTLVEKECEIKFDHKPNMAEKMLILLEYEMFKHTFKRISKNIENQDAMYEYINSIRTGFQWLMTKEQFENSSFELVPCDNDTNLHILRRKEEK